MGRLPAGTGNLAILAGVGRRAEEDYAIRNRHDRVVGRACAKKQRQHRET